MSPLLSAPLLAALAAAPSRADVSADGVRPVGAPLVAARSAVPGGSLRFLVLGDVHYDAPALRPGEQPNVYQKIWNERMPSLLGAAAAAAEREGAAFAVQLGDLANAPFRDRPTQERALREAYEAVASRLPVPLFPVIGNHESYGADAYPAWRAAMGPVLSSLFGASRRGDALWARREGDVLLVALDSNVDCAPETRLAFVRDALAANPDARHVFVLGHAPLLPSPTGQEGYARPFPFDPFGELLRLLQSRGATYLCADLHALSCERVADRFGAFSQLCLSSVCTPDKLAFRDGAAYPATDAERAGALRDPDPLRPVPPGTGWRTATDAPGTGFSWLWHRRAVWSHWAGDGCGFAIVRVDGDRVEADFYAWPGESVVRTFVLADPARDVLPLPARRTETDPGRVSVLRVGKPAALRGRPARVVLAELPPGWTADGGPAHDMSGDMLEIVLRRPDAPVPTRTWGYVRTRLEAPDGRLLAQDVERFVEQDVFEAAAAASTPQVSGDGPSGASPPACALAWDGDSLFVSLAVRDPDFAPVAEDALAEWWRGPNAELFLDPLGRRAERVDLDVAQLVLVPLADGAVRVLRYRTPAPGAAQDVAALAAEDAAASWRFDPATETLRLDLRLAWRAVAPASAPFEPASGAILGFDAAWRDRPLLGAEVKVHDRPSVWARVRLGRSEPD